MKIGALVAMYGAKPLAMGQLISECQSRVAAKVGANFHPYELGQVHATIVSLGSLQTIVNENFEKYRGRRVLMDYDRLLAFLRQSGYLPFQVQLGGFRDRDYPFTSRNLRPYERSFAFRDGRAVMIGWPVRGAPIDDSNLSLVDLLRESRIYPNTLDRLRQAFQGFGFLHTYYQDTQDVDNDFYLRIGVYDSASIPEELGYELEVEIREFLSKVQPLMIEIGETSISLVFSENEMLPVESTSVLQISDRTVTSKVIAKFYA